MNMTGSQYSELADINDTVNNQFDYETDQSGYGVGDLWAIMSGNDTGDCEDFALTKQQWLLDEGWDVSNLQLGLCWTETGGYHALMGVQTNNYGFLICDNRYDPLRTKEQLEGRKYRFDKFQLAGKDWAVYGVRKVGVPIEYMTCGASVFTDEDHVIVEFEDQDWSNPKVIGFASNPEPCEGSVFVWGTAPNVKTHLVAYNVSLDSWSEKFANYNDNWEEITGVNYQNFGFIFSGWRGTFDYIDYVDNFVVSYNAVENLSVNREAYGGNYRCYPGSFAIGNMAYIICGTELPRGDVREWRDHKAVYNDVTGYNMTTFVSLAKAVYPHGNWNGEGFTAGGKGYYVGGNRAEIRDTHDLLSYTAEYDQDLNIWSEKGACAHARWYHQTFGVGGYGYLCSGQSVTDLFYDAQRFDHVSGAWSFILDLPNPWNPQAGGSKKGVSGKGFVHATGRPAYGRNDSSMYIYNSATQTWSESIGTNESMGWYFSGARGCSFSV
jgi:hypothetical protein